MIPNEDGENPKVSIWKRLVPDFKIIFLLWLPLFAITVGYGYYRGYPDMGLFALAMAVAAWSVADAAVLTYRRFQEWRNQRLWAKAAKLHDTANDKGPYGKG